MKTKKPWGPEEVPTAFIFISSSDQQRTNLFVMSFRHHQFFPAVCIFIIMSLISKVDHPLTTFFASVNNIFFD